MEKSRAHYSLKLARKLVADGQVHITRTALDGAGDMGFERDEILEVVCRLKPGGKTGDFVKSMTTHLDHTVWQDVYTPMTDRGQVYLKLTILENLAIVSFKEK